MIDSVSPEQVERTASVNDDFLAVICADEELLDAEFDSIIAAAWGDGSETKPRPAVPPLPPGDVAQARHMCSLALRPQYPGIDGWARQRSPPRSGWWMSGWF
jgi:hypothetical protein